MPREMSRVKPRGSSHRIRKHKPTLDGKCLLCRLLWPIVVQHRHLLFDHSLEARTLLLTKERAG
ncbi:MAG: hypothetical protein QOE96_348 [Blastocatellia bacterium]|jgi:hypothetical protein|nr:hypothetical protein [Blastocatellia bacterium]